MVKKLLFFEARFFLEKELEDSRAESYYKSLAGIMEETLYRFNNTTGLGLVIDYDGKGKLND